jgi:hypothetical protein
MHALFLTTVLCIAPFSLAAAQTCSKQSPAYTVALLELYTSEGCDSCPQADRFVSGLRNLSARESPFGSLTVDQVVPLSLHVDYWDYIGWKDSFGKPAFTQRQRWLSDIANSRTIYTPEIFVAGQELRNWHSGTAAAIQRINAKLARAEIGMVLGKAEGGNLSVEVSATAVQNGMLFVALYENDLATVVKAGENRGVTLKHDYVVRTWLGPFALSSQTKNKNGKAVLAQTLALPAGAMAKNLGVAAFVQTDKGEILQALALSLCGT